MTGTTGTAGMPWIVLFNGPPRSGKDSAAKFLQEYGHAIGRPAARHSMSDDLKQRTHAFFQPHMRDIGPQYFENVKDTPHDFFRGMTPRQAYIWMAEEVIKPKFGKDFFGKVLTEWCDWQILQVNKKRSRAFALCETSTGFAYELAPLWAWCASNACHRVKLVRIHRLGHDFSNDSRQYIHDMPAWIEQHDMYNNTNLVQWEKQICDFGHTLANS